MRHRERKEGKGFGSKVRTWKDPRECSGFTPGRITWRLCAWGKDSGMRPSLKLQSLGNEGPMRCKWGLGQRNPSSLLFLSGIPGKAPGGAKGLLRGHLTGPPMWGDMGTPLCARGDPAPASQGAEHSQHSRGSQGGSGRLQGWGRAHSPPTNGANPKPTAGTPELELIWG